MQDVRRWEILGIRILGVLVIVLGLVLLRSPRIAYTTHERIRNTPYQVERERVILVPRAVAGLIAAGGLLAVFLARGSRPTS